MNRFALVVIVCSAQVAAAGKPRTVSATKAHPASKTAVEGCGLQELAIPDRKSLESAATTGTKHPLFPGVVPTVEQSWSWCVKPDLELRVWTACLGQGDSQLCWLYIARMSSGKLGAVSRRETGWSPPTVEDIDSTDAPSLWAGKGLKVTIEAGRGNAVFGAFVSRGTVKFTRPEWLND